MRSQNYFKYLFLLALIAPNTSIASKNDQLEALGKIIFFDNNLSSPAGRSCASCHDPKAGYAEPDRSQPTSQGSVKGRFSSRNTPTVTYARFVPKRYFDTKEKHYVGGLFLDGRAATLSDQAQEPMLSPVEMNNRSKHEIVEKVRQSDYAKLFKTIYGATSLNNDEQAFKKILQAIEAYERGKELNAFDSKFDRYLNKQVKLTAQELRGLDIFEKEDKGNCAACHPSTKSPGGTLPLFTDFTYDNLGVPANPKNPYLALPKKFNPQGKNFIDYGLGKIIHSKKQNGKFRVPTLRNIALTAPYMHNGVFTTLKEVVEFYNERDVNKKWGKPEVAENVNKDELGDLKLSEKEVDDLVAFMKTLTDKRLVDMQTIVKK